MGGSSVSFIDIHSSATGAPPRILQCCAVDFTVAHFLLPLMRAQREWGFEVHFACAPGAFVEEIRAEGFLFHPISFKRNFNVISHVSALRELRSILRGGRFSTLHVHTPVAALIGRVAARQCDVPLTLYTAHGFYFHEAMPHWKRNLHVRLERWAHRKADFLFTQSGEDAVSAAAGGIATQDRVLAIGNGVDLVRFSPEVRGGGTRGEVRQEFNFPQDAPVVLMLGRCIREKGYPDLFEAWERVHSEKPDARLLCVSPELESERDRFAEEAKRLTSRPEMHGSIILTGFREDVPRLMRASDVFVLPSWREGMPRSILEAMACGVSVVATDIRGSREEVVDDETGILVPPHHPPAVANAILSLLSEGTRREAMGRAGRRRAEAKFDEQKVIQAQKDVYERLFREKSIPWPEKEGDAS